MKTVRSKTKKSGSGKKALIATGIAAAAAAVCAGAVKGAEKVIVEEALDRNEPESMKKAKDRIAGKVMTEKEKELLRQNEERRAVLEAAPTERVGITAADGTRLVGHLYRAEDEKRILVAMHGWRSTWASDYAAIADFFRDNGCTVLYPEQRGQGESEGAFMSFGITERFDCVEWAKWADENCAPGLPIYLVGLSMGASTVLMASGTDGLPERVRGVLADCGFTSPHEIWQHVAEDNLKIPYRACEKTVERDFEKKTGEKPGSFSTVDAMEKVKIPILFVHGDADTFVPVDMTYQNYAAARVPKRLLIVEGAEHGRSYINNQAAYEEAVLAFFADFDSGEPTEEAKKDSIRIVPTVEKKTEM